GHYWTRVNYVDRGFFCASCKTHLLSGYECDYCTLKVDEVSCARCVAAKITCKTVQKPDDNGRFQHDWVIDRLILPEQEGFKPIIALTNTVCGSCTGKVVYRNFLRHLHPRQVDVRLVVAGGDGTISNVLETLEQFCRKPPMAVLPLGTGNDLSRVLGWGSGTNGDFNILEYLNDVYAADIQKLDRWNVMIKSKNQFGRRTVITNKKMSNYLSVGVDASVTFGMQTTRKSIPKVLSSRLVELPGIEGLVFLNIQYWGAGVQAPNMVVIDNDTDDTLDFDTLLNTSDDEEQGRIEGVDDLVQSIESDESDDEEFDSESVSS
ncbi:diacylglycerol kinase catalytic domain protein, partial [Ostertagia ostertagi]